MNYQKHYNNLMLKSRKRSVLPGIYVEMHHVIPKCLGGTNKSSNLVKLFPEEHIVAHLLLAKIHSNNDKIIFAAFCMTNGLNNCITKVKNNKHYKFIKEAHLRIVKRNENPSQFMSIEQRKARAVKTANTIKKFGLLSGKNHPLYNKGHTENTKQKISLNHADVSGANNGRAKQWKIVDPNGTPHIINGTLKTFCNDHNLSINVLKSNINSVVTNVRVGGKSTSTTFNTIGWSLFEI